VTMLDFATRFLTIGVTNNQSFVFYRKHRFCQC